ncbi:MAG TPA: hypothetical protein VIJ51_18850 [Solirubrobacteraceae bacterium]
MTETCYCGCDREVTGDDLALSESGQNIREILDVLKNLSLPLSQEIPEAKEKITGLIAHGERFDELVAGLIHGTVETPGPEVSRQMSAWLQTAGSVADTHMKLLGRSRKGGKDKHGTNGKS